MDKRKRALLPVVRERQSLADALVRYLTTLGLERKARELPTLEAYLATRTAPAPDTACPSGFIQDPPGGFIVTTVTILTTGCRSGGRTRPAASR